MFTIEIIFLSEFSLDLSVSSSSWCLGRAAVCDCGTPWTFLLPFFICVPLKNFFPLHIDHKRYLVLILADIFFFLVFPLLLMPCFLEKKKKRKSIN